MTSPQQPTTTEAIQTVILGKGVTDYLEVVDEVKRRFGLAVSQRMVEETYTQMKKHAQTRQVAKASALPESTLAAAGSEKLGLALKFVDQLGGLAQARQAIDQLEKVLGKLKGP